MDESAIKSLELNGCEAEIRESRISRIVVEGYDTSLRREDVEEALRKHFASCGNIIHVYVPINEETDIPNRFSFIYVKGEDEEKALRLNGSDMAGRILQTYAYPFQENYLDDVLATMKEARQPQRTFCAFCNGVRRSRRDPTYPYLREDVCSWSPLITNFVQSEK